MALINPTPASYFNYAYPLKYTFKLANGAQITGEYFSSDHYDERTGNAVGCRDRTKTNLIRHKFIKATERGRFFSTEGPHEFYVLNYVIGNEVENPVNTEKSPDILVEFYPYEETANYGNRAEIINYRSVNGLLNDAARAQAEAANQAERFRVGNALNYEEENKENENPKRKRNQTRSLPMDVISHVTSFIGSTTVPKFKWGGKSRKRRTRGRKFKK